MKKFNVNKYPKTTKYLMLYFHVHQPYRISNYSIFDIGSRKEYFEGPPSQRNDMLLERIANRAYSKANQMILELIRKHKLKVAYSITGTLVDQLKQQRPEILDQFRQMLSTDKTEIIAETYHHSLSFFYSVEEFARQVSQHCTMLNKTFGFTPQIFRNTEFTYRNDVGEAVRRLGMKGVFAEGWDPILGWRSPNFIYNARKVDLRKEDARALDEYKVREPGDNIKVILKNYQRSDDIAFRFQLKGWEGYPVTADKFANWIEKEDGKIINLCMDYETIGEHHKADSGIFEFYRHLPEELAKVGVEFILPSESLDLMEPVEEIDFPHIVSWADAERDLSAWRGNKMQENALEAIYDLKEDVYDVVNKLDTNTERQELFDIYGRLQTSDHFYYMSTKYWSDGDVHKYFSPYETPYQAFINYMNVLRDFKIRYLN